MSRIFRRMSKSFLVVFAIVHHGTLASGQPAPQTGVQWQQSLEDAKRLAAQSNRLVLVHFWSPSCTPCLQLEQNVFSQPQVQQAVQARFVPIKLNADDWPTTAKAFGITRLPTDLVITPGGQVVGRMLSPPTPAAYLEQLAIAASGIGPAASPPGAAYAMQQSPPTAAIATVPAPTAEAQRYAMLPQSSPTVAPTTQVSMPQAAAGPAISAYSDSRYAEFYQRFGGPSASQSAPAMNSGNAAAIAPPSQTYQSAPNPYSSDGRDALPSGAGDSEPDSPAIHCKHTATGLPSANATGASSGLWTSVSGTDSKHFATCAGRFFARYANRTTAVATWRPPVWRHPSRSHIFVCQRRRAAKVLGQPRSIQPRSIRQRSGRGLGLWPRSAWPTTVRR